MKTLAYYDQENDQPTLLRYMDELDVFVRSPIKTVQEAIISLQESGQIEATEHFDNAMTTLWSALMTWENIDHLFKGDLAKVREAETKDASCVQEVQ